MSPGSGASSSTIAVAESVEPDKAATVATIEAPSEEFIHLSHEGRLYVDFALDGQWYLTDTMTQERKALGPPETGCEWRVVVHPETGRGVVYLYSSLGDEASPRAADEILTKTIYIHPATKDMWLFEDRAGLEHRIHLPTQLTRMRSGKVTLRIGTVCAAVAMDVVMLSIPRACNQRIFFVVGDIDEALKLSSYKRQSSKWFYNQASSWLRRLVPFLQTQEFVVHSTSTLATCLSTRDACPGARGQTQHAKLGVCCVLSFFV